MPKVENIDNIRDLNDLANKINHSLIEGATTYTGFELVIRDCPYIIAFEIDRYKNQLIGSILIDETPIEICSYSFDRKIFASVEVLEEIIGYLIQQMNRNTNRLIRKLENLID